MFGTKSPHKAVLLLDIENGSVGSGLVRLSRDAAPELFGARRIGVPLMDTRSAAHLLRAVGHAASDAILHASEVAARMRHRSALPRISQAVVFLSAPWGVPNLSQGRPDFADPLVQALTPRLRALFGDIPVNLHAHASAAVHGTRAIYPDTGNALVVSINGEVCELILLQNGHVVGHATAPAGLNTVLRTLKAHAGLTEHEARSALRLEPTEAMHAAAEHFAGEFKEVARELYGGAGSGDVIVLAHEPGAEWFARALSHRSLADLYPHGGRVRVIRAGHLAPYVGSLGTLDTHLALSALYASAAHALK